MPTETLRRAFFLVFTFDIRKEFVIVWCGSYTASDWIAVREFSCVVLTKVFDALFAGDGFLGALAGACVGAGALAADREAAAVADASVAGDVAQTRNVLRYLAAELAFDGVVLVQERGDAGYFVFAELAGVRLRVDTGFVAQLAGGLGADAVQVR